jgi:hypothetical protein
LRYSTWHRLGGHRLVRQQADAELVPAAKHVQRQLDGFLLLRPCVGFDLDSVEATLKLVAGILKSLDLPS